MNSPICSVLAGQIADAYAELMDAHSDWDYWITREGTYYSRDVVAPDVVLDGLQRAKRRALKVEAQLASIGINVQEAHNRLKAKQEAES